MTLIIVIIATAIIISFFILRNKKRKPRFIPDKMMLTLYANSIKKQIFDTYPDFADSPDLIKRIYNEMVLYFHDERLFKKDYKFYKDCKNEEEVVLKYYLFAFMNSLKEVHTYKYKYKRQPKILLDWTKNELMEIGYTFGNKK